MQRATVQITDLLRKCLKECFKIKTENNHERFLNHGPVKKPVGCNICVYNLKTYNINVIQCILEQQEQENKDKHYCINISKYTNVLKRNVNVSLLVCC